MPYTIFCRNIHNQTHHQDTACGHTISLLTFYMALCITTSIQCAQPKTCFDASVKETELAGTPIYTLNKGYKWDYLVLRPKKTSYLNSFFNITRTHNQLQLVLTKALDLEAIYNDTKLDLSQATISILLKCFLLGALSRTYVRHMCQLRVMAVDEYPFELKPSCIDTREQNTSLAFHLEDNGDVKLARRLDYEAGDTVICMSAWVMSDVFCHSSSQEEENKHRIITVAVVVENLNDSPPEFKSHSYFIVSVSSFSPDLIEANDPDGDDVTLHVVLISSNEYLKFVHRWFAEKGKEMRADITPPTDHMAIVLEARDSSKLNPSRALKCPRMSSYAVLEVSPNRTRDRCKVLQTIQNHLPVPVHQSPTVSILFMNVGSGLLLVLVLAVCLVVLIGGRRQKNPRNVAGNMDQAE